MRHALTLAGALALAAWLAVVPAPAAAAGNDGSAECVRCHDEEDLPDMKRSPHARRGPPMSKAAEAMRGSPMAESSDPRVPTCIDCHGASPTHVKKPENVKERPRPDRVFPRQGGTPVAERNTLCLSCHQKERGRALWVGSSHEASDVSCTACHQVHTNHDKSLAIATQGEVCLACHKTQRVELQRPSHHPVPEGKMACSDCHQVHGSAGPKLARRDSTNATCTACHAEKRGPFVHAHEPVAEDCTICHSAHGSTVAGMLKARPPMLCQQCHTPHVTGAVGALAGQSGVVPSLTANGKNTVNLWQGRSCLNCHTQVHGSNNPAARNPTPRLQLR